MSDPTAPAEGPPDISPIRGLIRATARLLRSSWVATGLGLSLGLLAAALVVTSLLDLALPLGTALRATALVLVIVPAAWAFFAGVVRPAFRRLGDRQVARRIEGHIPGIHNRLVSCIDLDSGKAQADRSPAFYRRLVREALDRVKIVPPPHRRRPEEPSPRGGLRRDEPRGPDRGPRPLLRGAADRPGPHLLAVRRHPAGHRRQLSPSSRATRRSCEGRTSGSSPGSRRDAPEALRLEIRPEGGGPAIWHDLKKGGDGKEWALTLTASEKPFSYRVHGGGTWSKLYKVAIVDRPKIVGLHTALHYPAYMGIDEAPRRPAAGRRRDGARGQRRRGRRERGG